MGKVRIGKVKSVSNELVIKYCNVFTNDFDTNKKLVYQYTDITSKHLNNRVAGYVTRLKVNQKKRAEAEAAEAVEAENMEVAVVEAPADEAKTPTAEDKVEHTTEDEIALEDLEIVEEGASKEVKNEDKEEPKS